MRRQDDVDGAGGETGSGQRLVERMRPIERIDVALFRPHLVAGAAVDEHPAPRRLHQQRAHRQLNPMPIVRSGFLFPQHARHHAEHRAAIELERAVVQRRQLQVTAGRAVHPKIGSRARRLLQLDEDAVRR